MQEPIRDLTVISELISLPCLIYHTEGISESKNQESQFTIPKSWTWLAKKTKAKKKSVKPDTKSARLLKILSLNYWFENIWKHIYASTKFNYHHHYHSRVSTIKCFLNSEMLGLLYIRFPKPTIKEFCIFITIAWLCKPLDQLRISHSFWFLDKENNDYLSWVTYYLHSKLIYISLRNQGSAHN